MILFRGEGKNMKQAAFHNKCFEKFAGESLRAPRDGKAEARSVPAELAVGRGF